MRFFCEPFAKKNAKELVAGQKAGINHVLDGYNWFVSSQLDGNETSSGQFENCVVRAPLTASDVIH